MSNRQVQPEMPEDVAARATAVTVTPVAPAERIPSVDILRGFAVLGILILNIEFFGLPEAVIFNPTLAGGFEGLNLLTWKFGYLVGLQKMMAIFSMLFGAGLVLKFERVREAGAPLGGIYYRRIFWLLVIGAAHAWLIWYGDILFTYALCGLLLFLFRRRSPRALLLTGAGLLLFGMALQFGIGFAQDQLRQQAEIVAAAEAAGETLRPDQEAVKEAWVELSGMFNPTAEQLADEVSAYRGGFADVMAVRAPQTLVMQTQALAFFVFWRAMGLMLIGMGLMKLGVFSGQRSPRFYLGLAVVGYGVGLPAAWLGMTGLIEHRFAMIYSFQVGNQFNYVGGVLVALGHVGLIMTVWKRSRLGWLTSRLAAVGRMALTNYLLQSILCTTLFYGYGFGLFGQLDRLALLGVVLAVWVLQLLISPLWLTRFRFGPAEWVWRSLTYWRRQPMRVG